MAYRMLETSRTGCFELRDTRYETGFAAPEHVHEECCFQLVLRGTFPERSADVNGAYATGSLVFRPAGFRHENPRFDAPCRSLCVRLEPADFSAHFGVLAERRKTLLVRSPEALALGHIIEKEMRSSDDLTALLIEATCIQALGLLTREARSPAEHGYARLAQQAEALLKARYQSPLLLQDIAEELGVTRYTLTRAFHAHYGCHLGDYVQNLRLNAALQRIEETIRPIGEIAIETGFSDQSHLTRLFKQRFGITPYRLRLSR